MNVKVAYLAEMYSSSRPKLGDRDLVKYSRSRLLQKIPRLETSNSRTRLENL